MTTQTHANALSKLADHCAGIYPARVASILRIEARRLPDADPAARAEDAEILYRELCQAGGGGLVADSARKLVATAPAPDTSEGRHASR